MFPRIDHMFGHKRSLNKFKKIEITSSIFSDNNAMKLEINHKKNTEKHTKIWKPSYMLLNNEWVKSEINEEIKIYLETNDNEDTTIQNLWDSGKAILRRKFMAFLAYLKTQEKPEIKNLTSHLKELKKEQNKTQSE